MGVATLFPCSLVDYRSIPPDTGSMVHTDHRCCNCWKSPRLVQRAHVSPNDGKQESRLSYPFILTVNAPNCYTVQYAHEHPAGHNGYTATAPAIGPLVASETRIHLFARMMHQCYDKPWARTESRRIHEWQHAVDVWYGVTRELGRDIGHVGVALQCGNDCLLAVSFNGGSMEEDNKMCISFCLFRYS